MLRVYFAAYGVNPAFCEKASVVCESRVRLKLFAKVVKYFAGFLVIGVLGSSLLNLQNSFGGLLDKRKTQAQAHYMMGLFYENQAKFDQAIVEYKEALILEKDISAVHLRLGLVFIRKGDFDKAIEELEEAKQLEPDGLEPGLMLALLYTLENSSDKAAQEYEEVLKKASQVEPKNTDILRSLAALYYQQKKFENAISTYKLILTLDKKDYESVFLLGNLLSEIGKPGEAIEKFKEALKLNPDYADALNSLGYLYVEEGRNLDEAEELIKKALLSAPDNGAFIDSLGWVYYKRNQIDKAIEQLEKASSLLSDAVIYDHLGDAYFKKGILDKAAGSWEKSLGLDPKFEKVKEKLHRLKKDIS